jgi:hypothetical protein
MYVAVGGRSVGMFSFPHGQYVGELNGISRPRGLCSDDSGNVFVTEDSGVLEFAHGGTTPINTLTAEGAFSCSWDPSTGNLAVVEAPYALAVYANASGEPTVYTDSGRRFQYCAYDNDGNLFLAGVENSDSIVRFANGSFTTVTLNQTFNYLWDLQWDGKYLAIDDFFESGKIYRVKVSGSTGTVKQTITLGGGRFYGYFTWLQNGAFISPVGGNARRLAFWSYPSGGKPIKKFSAKDIKSGRGPIRGITVSVAPSRTRIRK